MSKKFVVSKAFSLRGHIRFLDAADKPVYESIGKLMSVRTVRMITDQSGNEVVKLTRDLVSATSDWKAEGKLGAFHIGREIASTRKYRVSGGKFDGVTTDSDLLDRTLDIFKGSETLARVAFEKGKLFTAKQNIELPSDDPDNALIAIILHVIADADRDKESSNSSSSSSDSE